MVEAKDLKKYYPKNLNQDYINYVEQLANEDSKEIFSNSSLSHAVVIAVNMFDLAKKSIDIFSGTLTELYFKKIKPILEKAAHRLKKDSVIRIITCEEKEKSNIDKIFIYIEKINKKIGQNVIKYLPLIHDGDPTKLNHFYVVDQKRWRVEEGHEKNIQDENNIKAKVCFNDINIAEQLSVKFNEYWNIKKRR